MKHVLISFLACAAMFASTKAQSLSVSKEVITVNGIQFTMVSVEGGTFMMGDTSGKANARSQEVPVHEVRLSSFSIGQTEVTQGLWESVMGYNPSLLKGEKLPVYKVSWDECQKFIGKLNQLTGRTFRLPTEAEWEFAARGGNMSNGYRYAGSNTLDDVAWFRSNSSRDVHEVGMKAPNELGLYDMSGNVQEWCQDFWSYDYYSSSPLVNPTGPATGDYRVIRGGQKDASPYECTVFHRKSDNPSRQTVRVYGFRLVQ